MDLFGDLPPPSEGVKEPQKTEEGAKGPVAVGDMSLFEDLPPESASEVVSKVSPLGRKRSSRDEDTTRTAAAPKRSKFCEGYKLKGYIGERRGEREDMQDAHTIIDDFTPQFTSLPNSISRVAYYGVFDGHGGDKASKYTAEHLHQNIRSLLPKGNVHNLDREVKKCLLESFKKTDEDFLRKAADVSPSWKDGTTVAALLVLDNTLYSANLGDSKAILCRKSSEGKLTAIPLTKDHNPNNFDERRRIEKAGGTVREGRVMGIVEVSRSIGDGRFKLCGIISVPDIFRCQLTDNDKFILVACDGLWKVFTSDEASTFVSAVLEDPSVRLPEATEAETNFESTRPASLHEVRYDQACNRIAVEAVKRGCTDNVTVMIIDIQKTLSK